MVISLPKIPHIHRIYMVLANLNHIAYLQTLFLNNFFFSHFHFHIHTTTRLPTYILEGSFVSSLGIIVQ